MPLIKTPWALTEKEKRIGVFADTKKRHLDGADLPANPTAEEIIQSDLRVCYFVAKEEIAQHHLENDFHEFLREYGTKEYYFARDVLIWLGY